VFLCVLSYAAKDLSLEESLKTASAFLDSMSKAMSCVGSMVAKPRGAAISIEDQSDGWNHHV